MAWEGLSFTANGNILPSRFVQFSAGNDYEVVQSDGTKPIMGVSREWLETYNGTYNATAGRPAAVFGLGETGLLQLGATVSAGDWLKSDSVGRGITASLTISSHQDIGARALMSGFVNEFIEVQVEEYSGVQGVLGT